MSPIVLSSQDVAATPAPTGTGAGVSASTDDTPWLSGQSRRFVRFSLFTCAIGLLGFFTDVVFATLALALTLATEEVALFATPYKLSFMTITLGLTGFRGLYQPVFARLRIQNDSGHLQRAFSIVTSELGTDPDAVRSGRASGASTARTFRSRTVRSDVDTVSPPLRWGRLCRGVTPDSRFPQAGPACRPGR